MNSHPVADTDRSFANQVESYTEFAILAGNKVRVEPANGKKILDANEHYAAQLTEIKYLTRCRVAPFQIGKNSINIIA